MRYRHTCSALQIEELDCHIQRDTISRKLKMNRIPGYYDVNKQWRDRFGTMVKDASSQIVTLAQEGIPKCHVSSTDSVILGKSEFSIHWNIERKGWWPFDSSIIHRDCTAWIKYHWFE